jgi:uncharacterized protein YbbK (DUF523 family)
MKIVSACLAGIKCRFDGRAKPCQKVIELVKKGEAIPLCPERLGGLPTPRAPTEIRGGKVYTKDGKDLTDKYAKGAKEALRVAKLVGCKVAILKSKSPSCGVGKIFDGTFSGKLIKGDGIFARLLKKNKIEVLTEKEKGD